MGNAVTNLAGKRVVVLSDNNALAQAIELALSKCLNLNMVRFVSSPPKQWVGQIRNDDFDLIVVATSLPTSEPVVMLTQASLAQQIGQVPLLIVSDRPFDPDMDNRFFHLDFPVGADELRDKVKEILQG